MSESTSTSSHNDDIVSLVISPNTSTQLQPLNTNNQEQKYRRRLSAKLNELQQNKNPTENCPICLTGITNDARSYASTCFHSFCYECLLEWSKIKATCPLCKCEFKTIIHSIKSINDYKEEKIRRPFDFDFDTGSSLETIRMRLSNFADTFYALSQSYHSIRFNTYRDNQWTANRDIAPVSFRCLVYRNQWRVSLTQIERDNGRLESVTRVRDTSALFYQQNIAQTHRLTSFLTRELRCLIELTSGLQSNSFYFNYNSMSQLIMRLIKEYDINSNEFLQQIGPHIRPLRYAQHFQHEFYAYAQSVAASLVEYDAHCVYFSDGNQVDISLYRQRQRLTIQNTSSLLSTRSTQLITTSNNNTASAFTDSDSDIIIENEFRPERVINSNMIGINEAILADGDSSSNNDNNSDSESITEIFADDTSNTHSTSLNNIISTNDSTLSPVQQTSVPVIWISSSDEDEETKNECKIITKRSLSSDNENDSNEPTTSKYKNYRKRLRKYTKRRRDTSSLSTSSSRTSSNKRINDDVKDSLNDNEYEILLNEDSS